MTSTFPVVPAYHMAATIVPPVYPRHSRPVLACCRVGPWTSHPQLPRCSTGRPVSRALWRAFVAEPRVAIRAIITEQQRRPNINFFTAGPPISDYTVATTAASAAASVQLTSLTPGAGPAG